MKRVLCCLALTLAATLGASRAGATAIFLSGFGISPDSPTSNDDVSLGGTLTYPTTGFSITMLVPTIGPPPNLLVVDVFVSSPAAGEPVLEILTSDSISVPFGKLAPGHYDWLVNVFDQPRGSDLGNGSVSATGSFTVPEPSALALLSLSLLTMTHGRSSRGQRQGSRSRRIQGAVQPRP
jgi:hypothetical protein